MAGECSAEQAMVQMIAVRVTTARKLMHEKPEGRLGSNRAGMIVGALVTWAIYTQGQLLL